MKWLMMCGLAISSLGLLAVDPTISDVMVQLENPRNGKVHISYTVTGDIAGIAKERGLVTSLKVTATDNIANETYTATALSGDVGLSAGPHSLVWDMARDGLWPRSTNLVFVVSCEKTPAHYCVVDLSAGSNAANYPVAYFAESPSGGFNTDEYKTTKLVLRRLEAGTYKMQNESDVTLTKPFFCGVFEMTQKQYVLVMGMNPSECSGSDTLPVEKVSYNEIRGASDGAQWPSSSAVDPSSFMGKLSARTGLNFDLPTDAQWEYACRAGTTTAYYWGDSMNGSYAWYKSNSSGTTHAVGSKIYNPWGLYDMSGNVWEWCLDWFGGLSYGIDPKGPSSGSVRVIRGGSWYRMTGSSTSSMRGNYAPSNPSADIGFRLVRTLPYVETIGLLCFGASGVKNFGHIEPWSISENLVAHYTFDGNANDTSGNGNDGVIHGVTSTTDRYGNADGAYHFDGTSAYIEVPDSDSLREVGQTVTISAWVKPEAWDNNWVSVLCKGYNDACRQYGLQINKSGKWGLNYYNGTKANELQAKAIELNTWNHVSVVYTPTVITAYRNGEYIGAMAPLGNMVENAEPLYIGFDAPLGDEYLTGDMDEVRVYNRALSAAEVRALSNGDNPTAAVIGEGTHVYRYDVGDGIGIVQSGFGTIDSLLDIPTTIGNKSIIAIGRYAFADCGDVEAVTIPSSVEEIGDSAFAGCSNLLQVTLSNDIRTLTVGGNAFDAATAVTIGNKPGYEFVGWTNAAGRVISDPFHSVSAVTVTPVWQRTETATIDGHTWTFIVSEDGRATIGNGTDVAVDPAPVGDLAIPEEIGGHPVMGIGNQAFTGCDELTSITIPSNVTSVGYGSFEGCTRLTNVVIETKSIDCVMSGLMQAKFGTRFDITSTLDDANDVANVSGVIAAYTRIEKTGSRDFSDPLSGNVYTWNESNSTFAYFGQMCMEAGKTYVFGAHFDDDTHVNVDGRQVLHVVYPDTVKKIGVGKYECSSSGWHNVEFRLGDIDGVKGSWGNIWSGDFGVGYRDDGSTNTTQSGWSRLLDPDDGSLFRCDGTRTIFAGCSNIVSVTMPWPLVSRMSVMFPDAYDKLESIMLTGDTVAIPEKAFSGCMALRSIEIPDSVTRIGSCAFQDCRQLTAMVIPNSVTNIGQGAFSGCCGLQSLILPFVGSERGNSLTQEAVFGHLFGDRPVDGMNEAVQYYAIDHTVTNYVPTSLTDVKITDESIIAKGAFDRCNSITNIKLNVGIMAIGEYSFAHCYRIQNMVIPDSVTDINKCAFEDCGGLVGLTIPSDVTNIGESAFYDSMNLDDVMIPNDVVTLSVGKQAFNANTSVHMADKNGYVFCGWTNSVGTIVADPFHSASAVTVSPWWKKTVTVTFDANGGYGDMSPQMVLEGDDLSLADNDFLRNGYLFLGWAETANGDVTYADGTTVTRIDAAADGTILYAIWKPCAPVTFPASDMVFPNMSQSVSLSCEANDAIILYTTDGSDPAINGREYKGALSVYESCVIRAIVRGAGRDSEETTITLTRAEPLSEAMNLYGYLMETDTSHPWTVVTDVSHDGVSCTRSGAIGHGGMTWLQTSMRKAGTVSFWWKAACEEVEEEDGETYWYDYGVFLVDGVEKAKIAGNDTGWRKVEVEVPSGGKHILRWEYHKDGATSYSPDCIWLDQVQWIPADGSGYSLTTPEPVPYSWLRGYNLGLNSDFERAAKQPTGKIGANGRAMSVWQDYVAGTDPTNVNSVFTAAIEMVDGLPHVIWSPNLNSNGEVRVYTVFGKTNLMDAAWVCPTNAAHRFFKVTVEMP